MPSVESVRFLPGSASTSLGGNDKLFADGIALLEFPPPFLDPDTPVFVKPAEAAAEPLTLGLPLIDMFCEGWFVEPDFVMFCITERFPVLVLLFKDALALFSAELAAAAVSKRSANAAY